jgi:hypothetical protein
MQHLLYTTKSIFFHNKTASKMPTTKKQRFKQSYFDHINIHETSPDKYVQTSTVADFDGAVITTMFLADPKHGGQDIQAQFEYVLSAYDDDLRLIRNPQIQIKYWEFTAIQE